MIVDTQVYLSRWPFRRVAGDETPELVERLMRHGVTQAWAGSFDALLHEDIAAVNTRLAEECRRQGRGLLLPFGTVNPTLPDWEDDVRRCKEEHRMPGIRLHPNYHGYKLDDPVFERLLRLAAERSLIVQLAVKMEDERTHHPLLRLPAVDIAPLPKLLPGIPGLRLVVLNALRSPGSVSLKSLATAGSVFFDVAMLENLGGLALLIERAGIERVLFGSLSPIFVFEAAPLKIKEAGLDEAQERAILHENARRLLGSR